MPANRKLGGAALCAAALGLCSFSDAVFAEGPEPAPAPKKVAILVFDGVQVIDYSGPFEVFGEAGYEVFTVAETRRAVTTAFGDGEKIVPKYTFADAPQADIVVIPGGEWEARSGSAASAWILRENAHDQRTLSVCNGAFTLASTGLLDGLRATTTAGNIVRLQQSHPQIQVVNDQRVVDNGKILTSAGLSAGIDGALHTVAVLDGEEAARSVALGMEYDWRPYDGYVRGTMADHLIPFADPGSITSWDAVQRKGDKDHWEKANWLSTRLSAEELFDHLRKAYEKAYAAEGPWSPGSFHSEPSGALRANLGFDDRQGGHWNGTLSVEPIPAKAHQFVVRITTARAA